MQGSLSLNFPPTTKLIHFHSIYLKTKGGRGHGGGSSEPPEPKLDPQLETPMYMYANALHSGCILHEHATHMYFKKYMGRVVL